MRPRRSRFGVITAIFLMVATALTVVKAKDVDVDSVRNTLDNIAHSLLRNTKTAPTPKPTPYKKTAKTELPVSEGDAPLRPSDLNNNDDKDNSPPPP